MRKSWRPAFQKHSLGASRTHSCVTVSKLVDRQAGRQAGRHQPTLPTRRLDTTYLRSTLSHQHCRRLPKAIPPLWRRKLLLLSWTSMLAPMPRALLRSTPLTMPQRYWLLETRLRRQRLSFVRLSDRYCHQSGRSSRWQLGLWPTCCCK